MVRTPLDTEAQRLIGTHLHVAGKVDRLTLFLSHLHRSYQVLRFLNSINELEEFVEEGLRAVDKLFGVKTLLLTRLDGAELRVFAGQRSMRDIRVSSDPRMLLWDTVAKKQPSLHEGSDVVRRFYGSGITMRNVRQVLSLPLLNRHQDVIGLLNIHAPDAATIDMTRTIFFRELAHAMTKTLERSQHVSRLKVLSSQDELTGLYNRRYFNYLLEREIKRASRYGSSFVLGLIDLNDFKKVNDTLGHLAGDELLKSVAARIMRRARATDIAARLGGDEFALVLLEAGKDNAQRIMEDINASVGRIETGGVRTSLSFGVAAFPGDAASATSLIDVADRAMYRHKKTKHLS